MRTVRTIAVAAVAVVTAAGLAACGSSATSGGKADIKLMVSGALTPSAAFGGISFPYGATGAKAAAAAINASGGIDGHLIHLDLCDTHGSPNGSATCGRSAISNHDIAVVGAFDPLGAPQILAVLQTKNIPYLGGLPATYAEFTSPISFQFDPGPILSGFALAKLWADSGCKNVAAILPANPGNDKLAKQQSEVAQSLGLRISNQLVMPGIADITPSLTKALSSKPDCFTYSGDGQTNVKYILALHKDGYTGQILTSAGSLLPQFLGPLGAAANGIKILNSTAAASSKDPAVTQFDAELSTYLHSSAPAIAMNSNEFAQDGWSSVQLVKQALTGASALTSAALIQKIPTMCDVSLGNVYPHVNFCKSVSALPSLPRVYNDSWQYFVVKNGMYVPLDGIWRDLSSTIPTS